MLRGLISFRGIHRTATKMEDFKPPSRHPSHLKGKEIGLFYARRNRGHKVNNATPEVREARIEARKNRKTERQGKRELLNRATVVINDHQGFQLHSLLQDIRDDPNSFLPKTSTTQFEQEYRAHLESDPSDHQLAEQPASQPHLDSHLQHLWQRTCDTSKYQQMLRFRSQLPIYKLGNDIINVIESNQVTVISGETGSGKTTQTTQFILDHYLACSKGSTCNIVCTQPRRISAITVSERVAEERGEKLGESVGYQIRLESRMPRPHGSILYCTTGILLQKMKGDVNLKNVSHVFLDEVHERDLDTDFLMIILKDLLPRRPDLKIVLMSATINSELFSKYFGNCPILNIPGIAYPVEKFMLEDVIEMLQYRPDNARKPKPWIKQWKKKMGEEKEELQKERDFIETFLRSLTGKYSDNTIEILRGWNEEDVDLELITELIRYICLCKPEGAILVFLPGWANISSLHKLLSQDPDLSRELIFPLHSLMPTINQKEVFSRPPRGVRKIILATNIAETSITIDDVVYVIDCGMIKMSNYNGKKDLATLKPEWISLANAQQRRGRAGRVQPGVCYHLVTTGREMLLPSFMVPEMLRTRLETLCLKIKILNLGRIAPFLQKAIEPPQPRTLENSISFLHTLNALDKGENLTPLGFHLARLPLDPQTGKMILFGAIFSCLDPILTVAASLSFKNAFVVPLGKERLVDKKKEELAEGSLSDHIMLIKAFQGWERAARWGRGREYCYEYFLSPSTLRMLADLRQQLGQYLLDLQFLDSADIKAPKFNANSDNLDLVRAIVCAGLYPNVAKLVLRPRKDLSKRPRPPLICTKGHEKVAIHPMSVNAATAEFPTQWLVYYTKISSSGIFLHDTTPAEPCALFFFGGEVKQGRENGEEVVTVDDWVVFKSPAHTTHLILELRENLNNLLKYKVTHPGPTQWNREGQILQPIIDLVSSSSSMVPPPTAEQAGPSNLDY